MVTIELNNPIKFNNEEQSAFISFDYDAEIVEIIKTLPFRYYHVDRREWEIPVNQVKKLQDNLFIKHYEYKVVGKFKDTITKLPRDFHFKTKPFEHQKAGVIKGLNCNRWFLGDEQGLGKTKQIIDIAVARKIKYGYKHCLIVCGVNTLKWNWVNEIEKHSYEQSWILGQKTLKNGKTKIGSSNDKFRDLQRIEELPYFIITNVESFRDNSFANMVHSLCVSNEINMIAADEMHKMKNPTSQQTKGFLKANAECEIGMTGTPLMNSPLDLYVILRWLGYESHAFYSFKNHYCVMGGYGGYEVVGFKNMEQLTQQVQTIMLRRLKDDVLDLPEKLYVDEYVDLLPNQEKVYKEVTTEIKSHIDKILLDSNPLASLIRLRQATGYTGILSTDIQESAKLNRMMDLVEEAVSNKQKVLIFTNWTQITDVAYRMLKTSFDVSQITGDTPDYNRQHIVDTFQNTPEIQVLIGTIGAMGTGLTLTKGTVIIFLDEPWNKALYEQAVDRAHRIGQKNKITIYNLLTKGTIDERIHQLVYKKGKMSDAIIDGKLNGSISETFMYLLG